MGELKPLQAKWQKSLAQLAALEERENQEAATAAEASYNRALQLLPGLTCIAVLLGLIAAWTIIDGIAFQTNILASNAAVEAVRAGEQAVRAKSVARQALATKRLGKFGFLAHPEGFHLWPPLTSWSVVEFASWLRTKGAGVAASAAFSTDGDPPDAVRICLGGPISRDECDAAPALVADTLEHPRHPHATVM